MQGNNSQSNNDKTNIIENKFEDKKKLLMEIVFLILKPRILL